VAVGAGVNVSVGAGVKVAAGVRVGAIVGWKAGQVSTVSKNLQAETRQALSIKKTNTFTFGSIVDQIL